MRESLRKRVALHEAAHAVVGHVLGYYVAYVGVGERRLKGGVSHGLTKLGWPKMRKVDPLKDAMLSLAGDAAEEIWHGRAKGRASRGDLEAVRRLGFSGRSIAAAMSCSRDVVRFYGTAIKRVSKALLKANLGHREFRKVCRLRKGEMA